jgi:type IV pilus assembly protein PilV
MLAKKQVGVVMTHFIVLQEIRQVQMRFFKQKGFSLTEVLVAVLVLTLGIIGAAGMQLTATRTSQHTLYHGIGLQIASEIADGIRANDSEMRLSDGNNRFMSVDYDSSKESDPGPPPVLCYATACDSGQLALFDIHQWKTRVRDGLPGGRLVICRDARPWNDEKSAFAWDCTPGSGERASLVIKLGWRSKQNDGKQDNASESNAPVPPIVAITVEPYPR